MPMFIFENYTGKNVSELFKKPVRKRKKRTKIEGNTITEYFYYLFNYYLMF